MVDSRVAARLAPAVVADRIRLARELRGWTQQEVVEQAGRAFSAAALSQLERGHTRPSPATLVALAKALDCPMEFFVARSSDSERIGFFRSMTAAPARERRRHLAEARLLHELVAAVEEHLDLPELRVPRFPLTDTSTETIEAAAGEVRRRWKVEPGPIPHVVRLLERNGIVVVRQPRFRREIDAFSVRYAERPVVVLGSEKAVTARSRFDAAHELGHLVMHGDSDAGKPETERQAHQFAAAFLMPAADIAAEVPDSADWPRLMELKWRWRVSMAALLRRARTLGVMSQHRYELAMKSMSARGWRRVEPGDERLGALETPILLDRAVRTLTEGGMTIDGLAAESGLPADVLKRLVSESRSRPRLEI